MKHDVSSMTVHFDDEPRWPQSKVVLVIGGEEFSLAVTLREPSSPKEYLVGLTEEEWKQAQQQKREQSAIEEELTQYKMTRESAREAATLLSQLYYHAKETQP